jgi:hypothetical protein
MSAFQQVDTMGWNLLSGNSTTNAFANCSLTALQDTQPGILACRMHR